MRSFVTIPTGTSSAKNGQVKAFVKSISKEGQAFMSSKQAYSYVASSNEQSKEDDIKQFSRIISFVQALKIADPSGFHEVEVCPLSYAVDGAAEDADEFRR